MERWAGGGGVGEFTERIKDKASHSSLLCFSHVTNSQHCKFRPSDKGGGEGGAHPDPEVRWGGGVSKNFYSALCSSVRSENKGGWGAGSLPWIHH